MTTDPKHIRRSFFFMTLLLLTSSAQAEWLLLGRTENFRVYLDQGSVRQKGEFIQTVQLMDFVTAQWIDAQRVIGSLKTQVEYDCNQPRSRTLGVDAISEQMGEGRLISSNKVTNPQLESVQSGTTAETIWKLVCGSARDQR